MTHCSDGRNTAGEAALSTERDGRPQGSSYRGLIYMVSEAVC